MGAVSVYYLTNLEDPFAHKFVFDSCFDTLFVESSAFSETRAFRNNRADLAEAHERDFCATRLYFPQLFPQLSAISKSVAVACFGAARF